MTTSKALTNPPEIKLKAGGSVYKGWKELKITKSMTSLCGTFDLVIHERFSKGKFSALWGVQLGSYVEIWIGEIPYMIGWVDRFGNAGPSGHPIQFGGRSLLCDIVDCSYVGEKSEWFDTNLLDVVTELTAGFANVQVDTGTPLANFNATGIPFPQVTVQQGDSIFNKLRELCKQRAVLPMGGIFDADRHMETLLLTTVGSYRSEDALISGTPEKAYWRKVGHNIKSWNQNEENINRFSIYYVKGNASNNDPINTPEGLEAGLVTGPTGSCSDTAIKRYRPLVIIADGPGNQNDMDQRAKWEAMTRAGASRRVSFTIQGWTTMSGEPWDINWLIPVNDQFTGIYTDMLIETVTLTKSKQGGTTTTFGLVHPDSYILPTVDKTPGDIRGTFDPNTPEPYKS